MTTIEPENQAIETLSPDDQLNALADIIIERMLEESKSNASQIESENRVDSDYEQSA